MIRRPLLAALAASAGAISLPATLWAQTAPGFVSPTTTSPPTTAPPLVIVTPTTSTTTTTTTTTPVVVAPATPTTSAEVTVPPVIAAPTTTTVPEPDVTIGGIDPDGEIPDGFDLTAFPDGLPAPTPGVTGDLQLTAEPSCATQCIRAGVAYPRGFGALLVVETWVPAAIVLVVNADTDGDGSVDYAETLSSVDRVTEYRPALDHLTPGTRYVVYASATDEHLDTAHAYGEFTTLSQRAVEISLSAPAISYGPTNVVDTDVSLKVADLDFDSLALPAELTYYSLPRHLDLALFVFRTWETSQYTFCEGLPDPDLAPPQGDNDDMCGAWNTATLDNFDLDRILPYSSWTEYSASSELTSWDEGSLPGQPSDPRYFHVSAEVTISVEYS